MATRIGSVTGLYRYPVKSMSGESLPTAEVGFAGIEGDRSFGLIDRATGRLLSAKTVPALLQARATFDDGGATVTLPGDVVVRSDDADLDARVSEWLGRDVMMQRPGSDRADIDIIVDLTERGGGPADLFTFQSMPGAFFDSTPLHVLTTKSLASMRAGYPVGDWSIERFRPNVVIALDDPTDEFPEDAWVGSVLRIGELTFDVRKRCDRCVLTTRDFPSGRGNPEILRTLHRVHGGDLGVKVVPLTEGPVSSGDPVELV